MCPLRFTLTGHKLHILMNGRGRCVPRPRDPVTALPTGEFSAHEKNKNVSMRLARNPACLHPGHRPGSAAGLLGGLQRLHPGRPQMQLLL
ncbi:hypothetical protein EMIT0P201_10862 [Pseudomonas chlororaphis]